MTTSTNNNPLRFIIGSFAAGVVFAASADGSESARIKDQITSQMDPVNPPNVKLENENPHQQLRLSYQVKAR